MAVLKLPKEVREDLGARVQVYIREELDVTIGNLAAENLLFFVLEHVGSYVYNQALEDARFTARQQMERLDEELEVLRRVLPAHRGSILFET